MVEFRLCAFWSDEECEWRSEFCKYRQRYDSYAIQAEYPHHGRKMATKKLDMSIEDGEVSDVIVNGEKN